MTTRYLIGDVFDRLADIPDSSVDLVMTSPPFLALRSYLPDGHPDKAKEIGSEPTPAEFLDTMLALTAEWRRVLAPHGSICVELGDTYAGSGGAGGDYNDQGLRAGQQAFSGSAAKRRANGIGDEYRPSRSGRSATDWPMEKSLTGIPTLYAWSLAYGRNLLTGQESPAGQWRIRNLVAWVRPNPPVGALGDKFRPATSYLTCATVARDRWFDLDAVRTAHARDYTGEVPSGDREYNRNGTIKDHQRSTVANPAGAPPLDWWEIPPGGYSGAHYAVYPPELCRRPIDAMCPRRVCTTCGTPSTRAIARDYVRDERGGTSGARRDVVEPDGRTNGTGMTGKAVMAVTTATTGWSTCGCPDTDGTRLDGFHTGTGWRAGHVLDPFGGTGTTAVVATGLGRTCTLIDIDERNLDLARQRLGMFLEIDHTPSEVA